MSTASTRIPLIRTGQALQSLRDSGHSLPTALGEPIDNSIEAGANIIHVRLDDTPGQRGKRHVHRIAIADDGSGMDRQTLHQYLVLGFSTRYMRTDTIGKYGVGAKLAALNFACRFDVWSRQSPSEPWLHVYFDLTEALEAEKAGQEVGVESPVAEAVPEDLQDLLPTESGTLVVWSKVDRLEEGRLAPSFDLLRVEVERELSRIFRYFINGGIKLLVNGRELLAHDPLFLMENTWADEVMTKALARELEDDARQKRRRHFAATVILNDEPIKIGDSNAKVTVTLYPKEVIRKRGQGGDALAKDLRIPDNQGCISFIRLNREVSYTNVPRIFGRSVDDPDRFIGIQVAFDPTLDAFFGVRNVKRGVEPHGELREQLSKLLKRYLKTARDMIEDIWGAAAKEDETNHGEHTAVTAAAKNADRMMPKGRAKGPASAEGEARILDDLATDVVGNDEEAKKKYIEKIRDLPFVLESVDWPGTNFIDIKHLAKMVIIRLNTRHRFYREMWEPTKEIATRGAGGITVEEAVKASRRTIEALELLVIAFGKAQSMDENPDERYSDLTPYWGQFLDTLMGRIKGLI
ncbi:MAG: ATP-binding protein [Chthoniobacteraceae bacterium]